MSIHGLLKHSHSLPQSDFYTYEFFEHPEELKEALPEKKALLNLPVEKRVKALAQKITIQHLSPDGDKPVLSIAPYLLRFPIDDIIELLKELPEKNQISLLNASVEELGYRHRPFLFFLPGNSAGYEKMGAKKTVYETCLQSFKKAKKMANYVSSLSQKSRDQVKVKNKYVLSLLADRERKG